MLILEDSNPPTQTALMLYIAQKIILKLSILSATLWGETSTNLLHVHAVRIIAGGPRMTVLLKLY
jgi:hypothetical protein